jgi:hypothetical protein
LKSIKLLVCVLYVLNFVYVDARAQDEFLGVLRPSRETADGKSFGGKRYLDSDIIMYKFSLVKRR